MTPQRRRKDSPRSGFSRATGSGARHAAASGCCWASRAMRSFCRSRAVPRAGIPRRSLSQVPHCRRLASEARFIVSPKSDAARK
eukprot:CAMPEP_0197896972 /NCGR_PEP_ID=MMETSP1439-20131203/41302_1 /TAXON_ID=66791 /ORGANISM="Gonyaulax spinifera, Strain CCMP409" /LENGTH=83 /DNA_ID=CAMNT_0043517561 /DNA_START=17 /DNA_END=265 /DNA_ORIENTATION=+